MSPFVLICALNSSASGAEIPFQATDHAIIVEATLNGRTAHLMFDTGFGGTAIVGEELDVGKPTGFMTLVDFIGSFQAPTVKLTTFKVGDVTMDVADKEIVHLPSDHSTESYGTHCDGILGLSAFNGHIFEINFQRKVFIVHPKSFDILQLPVDGKVSFKSKLLPLGNRSLMMSAQAPNGEKLHLALDTGNSFYATTHKDALERVKLWPEGKKVEFMSQSMVASGPVDSFSLELANMKIFGVDVPTSVWDIIDLPSSTSESDGTVGYGFLKNFNIVIDQDKRVVVLNNFSGKTSEPEPAEVGLFAFNDPRKKRVRVGFVMPDSPAEKAGVKAGDDVLSIDGLDVSTMGYRRLRTVLQGEAGTKVKIDLSRQGQLIRLEIERKPLVNKVTPTFH